MDIKEQLKAEIERCKGLVEIYKTVLMGGLGAALIQSDIDEAESALQESKTEEVLSYILEKLKGCN